MGKRWAFWGIGLGALYAAFCTFLYTQQGRFIFAPTPTIEKTPARYRLAYDEVNLSMGPTAPPQDRLNGWWIPASAPQHQTLLYCHGNGLNIGANVDHAYRFHQMGLSVFLFDYRGYGQSRGAFPTETSVYADVERAWTYLTQDRHISPSNILIYGHSLGGAIAIELATRHPNAGGLIVQSSFTSALEMARRKPWTVLFPTEQLLTQRFDSIAKVARLQLPVLFIHGTQDSLIPSVMSERLYAANRSPLKQLKLFPKANHNNVAEVAGSAYTQAVKGFVHQALASRCKDCAVTLQMRQSGSTSAPILR
ncbi:MAG: alpha/beta fold hydrolase [Thermosynechococcaceae cyanobacterium]